MQKECYPTAFFSSLGGDKNFHFPVTETDGNKNKTTTHLFLTLFCFCFSNRLKTPSLSAQNQPFCRKKITPCRSC